MPVKVFGLTRKLRRRPDAAQCKALEAYGCTELRTWDEREFMVRSIRQGDLVVVVAAHALGPTRADVEALMCAILEKRAGILELESKLHVQTPAEAVQMAMRAVAGLTGDSRALTPAQAKRAGKLSSKRKRAARTSDDVAGKWWRSKRAAEMLIEDAMQHEAMYGWSTATAYRRLGPRGSAAGRRRNT